MWLQLAAAENGTLSTIQYSSVFYEFRWF